MDTVMEFVRTPSTGFAAAAAAFAASGVSPFLATPPPPDEPPSPDRDRRPEPEKLTVNLIENARKALYDYMRATGCSKTVATNRALQYLQVLMQAVEPDPVTGLRGHVVLVDHRGRAQELVIVP